ncbi:hypothetical protein GCM10011374_35440 [Kocuria dechangensis]|uniref:Uncharacterized protein n=1 Tax=Kocuria dechangensis TaxID=1176249 RepID=A0A917H5R3_9MICC|nr:type IV secretion system DNA-binding domain-containing protein [Kocuria dechangensis]GGG68058.1 hypothetical protein GCM10011374_35440 [Kocuria dechangensis]
MSLEVFSLAPVQGINLNPLQFAGRADVFASAATQNGPFTLLVVSTGATVADYVLVDAAAANANAPVQLAQTVGARSTAPEAPEIDRLTTLLADTQVLGRLRAARTSISRATQAGADPTDLAAAVAPVLAAGEWVAVTARRPLRHERKAHLKWLAHRLGTRNPQHHSMTEQAVVVSVRAGASGADRVRSLLNTVSAAMPGFDVSTTVSLEPRHHPAWKAAPAAAALLAASVAAFVVGGPDYARLALAGILGAAALGAISALSFTGKLTSPAAHLTALNSAFQFPPPPRRRLRPKPPREASTQTHKNADGTTSTRHIAASAGDYPVHRDAFYLGPSVIAGLVSPHIGAAAGDVSNAVRATSPAMSTRCGFNLGSNDGVDTYIPATDTHGGIAVVGAPGTGKSFFMQAYYAYCARERVAPSGQPGYPGRANSLIVFESKDAAPAYQRWAKKVGDRTLLIDVADKRRASIDFFSCPGVDTLEERATMIVNAMVYAWGDKAIGDRSKETLTDLFTAALVINDELLTSIPARDEHNLPTGASPFYYLYVLLGARGGDPVAVSLATAILDKATRLRERGADGGDWTVAAGAVAKLYGPGVSFANRRPLLEAPRNKVQQLYLNEQFFSPARKKITFEQVLAEHKSIIFNTGKSASGRQLMDDHAETISAMTMYLLYRNIMAVCSGRQEQSRRVTIIADELSTLAGSNEMVLSWFRDKGRSFGVEAVLGTQRPEQLTPVMRNNVMTYATLISFAHKDRSTASEIADAVSGAGVSFTAEELQLIPLHHAVIRSQSHMQLQPAAIVHVHNFPALGAQFLDLHFGPGAGAAATDVDFDAELTGARA